MHHTKIEHIFAVAMKNSCAVKTGHTSYSLQHLTKTSHRDGSVITAASAISDRTVLALTQSIMSPILLPAVGS